jgi:putative ABC transport system ATP-binding protein
MSLSLDNVTVTVPDGLAERTILDRVSLSVEPGEIVALTGASGSGKSTLLAVAALLMVPQTGRITVAGTNASEAGDKQRTALRRRHIGVIYQTANLFPSLTAREQLHLTAHVGGHLDSAARQRADELLDHVGLTSRAGARPAELSGGERQRVGIARALMGRPSVLLADEPTAALDSERGEAIIALLAEQAEAAGAATMVVTHVPEQLHATRTLSIADGRVSELMAARG